MHYYLQQLWLRHCSQRSAGHLRLPNTTVSKMIKCIRGNRLSQIKDIAHCDSCMLAYSKNIVYKGHFFLFSVVLLNLCFRIYNTRQISSKSQTCIFVTWVLMEDIVMGKNVSAFLKGQGHEILSPILSC